MKTYLKTSEAAAMLGMTPRSVQILVKSGKIAVHYLGPSGGMVRFTEEDLETYLLSTRKYGSRVPSPLSASRRRGSRNGEGGSSRPGGPATSTAKPNRRRVASLQSQTVPESTEE